MCVLAYIGDSEENLQEVVLFFHHVGQTQVAGFSCPMRFRACEGFLLIFRFHSWEKLYGQRQLHKTMELNHLLPSFYFFNKDNQMLLHRWKKPVVSM